MAVDVRALGHQRIDVGDSDEDRFGTVGGRSRDRKLIEIARVVIVDRGPQQGAQVAHGDVRGSGRVRERFGFGHDGRREVGQEPALAHRIVGYVLEAVTAGTRGGHECVGSERRSVHCRPAVESRLQAERIERTYGRSGFQVRVGVHTGHVLLGGGVDDEGTIRGFTVNIAARLEQTAPPGGLRISQETWRHVRGVFDFEAQPPLQVKGQDEPLRTWLVLRAKPRAFRVATRGIEGAETPLVGRDAELAQLVAAFDATLQTRKLQALTLLAEAGLGKSRLIQELQQRLESYTQPCWLLLGRAQPSGTLQPYGLLRDVLAWRLQIADSDSAEVARRRLVEGVAPYLGEQGELRAELLGQLVGMDFSASPHLADVLKEPRQLRDRALAAFDRYVQALCDEADSPVVVMLLDDLQWADDASLDWLAQLMTSGQLPMLLVMGARPELIERRPAWGEGTMPHAIAKLAALDADQRHALTSAVLQRLPGASSTLRALIEKQAEGNPFYAEELVKMLIDDGVIVVEDERWRVLDERLSTARIPSTLTGVLQARLDALSAAERRAAQLASVVGPVFWDDALHTLDPNAPPMLPALEHKAIVQSRMESAFAGTREVAFQHHLLHQVTYDTVLKSDRREAHARTAAWLAARVGDREDEYLAVTAEHYERAGDHVLALQVRACRGGGAGALRERGCLDLPAAHARHARVWRLAAALEGGADAGHGCRPGRRPSSPPRRDRRGNAPRRCARRRRAARLGGRVLGAARRSPRRPRRSRQTRATGRRTGRALRRRRRRNARPCRVVVAGTRVRRHRAGAPTHGAGPAPGHPGGPGDEVAERRLLGSHPAASSPPRHTFVDA